MKANRTFFIISAIALAVVSRIVPHPDNVTPVMAIALFGGACFSNRLFAFIVPITGMLISDLIIGMHNTLPYVYGSMILTVCIGLIIKNKTTVLSVVAASVISSVLFFIITNFGVWATYTALTPSLTLTDTYLLGIPFFRNELLGTLLYNSVLFGGLYFAGKKFPQFAK